MDVYSVASRKILSLVSFKNQLNSVAHSFIVYKPAFHMNIICNWISHPPDKDLQPMVPWSRSFWQLGAQTIPVVFLTDFKRWSPWELSKVCNGALEHYNLPLGARSPLKYPLGSRGPRSLWSLVDHLNFWLSEKLPITGIFAVAKQWHCTGPYNFHCYWLIQVSVSFLIKRTRVWWRYHLQSK